MYIYIYIYNYLSIYIHIYIHIYIYISINSSSTKTKIFIDGTSKARSQRHHATWSQRQDPSFNVNAQWFSSCRSP